MSLVKFGFHGVLIISGLEEANQAGRSRDKGNVKLLNRNIKYKFLCLYGYSMSCFIPISILCSYPNDVKL